ISPRLDPLPGGAPTASSRPVAICRAGRPRAAAGMRRDKASSVTSSRHEREAMRAISRSYRWVLVTGIVHVAEQLGLGLDERDDATRLLAACASVFGDADYATVALLIAASGLGLLLFLATLAGGRSRMRAAGLFGVVAVAEIHH